MKKLVIVAIITSSLGLLVVSTLNTPQADRNQTLQQNSNEVTVASRGAGS
nr:hypothetical protein P5645_10125 [Bacillus subtilis]WGD74839.1 hypothetical protein P5631_12630 [Bacillus subtilis]